MRLIQTESGPMCQRGHLVLGDNAQREWRGGVRCRTCKNNATREIMRKARAPSKVRAAKEVSRCVWCEVEIPANYERKLCGKEECATKHRLYLRDRLRAKLRRAMDEEVRRCKVCDREIWGLSNINYCCWAHFQEGRATAARRSAQRRAA